MIAWTRGYSAPHLRGDLVAGLTTAVMLIPQGMAYAMLAGLPPVVGLYASVFPLVAYSLVGTSRELAVGPVAMVSLMVASAVGAFAPVGSTEYASMAVLLAALVGVGQIAMGSLRLGFLTNFLSHPVLSGFTSAAALIIGFSQLGHVLGYDIPRSHHVHAILLAAIEGIGELHGPTALLAAGAAALILGLRRWRRSFPGALAAIVVTTLAVWGFGLHDAGVKIVGDVPEGLPPLAIPAFDSTVALDLLPAAVTIALVGFMESMAVAKAFARRARYEVDANRELLGLGLANAVGSLFSAYPVTGGFSRTAVNAGAGARSRLAGLITAAAVALTLSFLTPIFHFMPKATLAAIIVTAVVGLIDVDEVRHLWRVKRTDLGLLVVTFVATLSLGIELGIGTGVAASLLWFVVRTTRPHFAVLGRLPGTRTFRNLKRHPEARTTQGVLVIRMDAQFYFGNMSFLKERLRSLEQEISEPLRAIVIEGSSINDLDSSADAALHELLEDFASRGITLYFASIKGPVRDVMKRSGFTDAAGAERFFNEVADAVDTAAGTPPGEALSSGTEPLAHPAEV